MNAVKMCYRTATDPFNHADPVLRMRRERLFRAAHALGPRPLSTTLLAAIERLGGADAVAQVEAEVGRRVELAPVIRVLDGCDFPSFQPHPVAA